MGVELPINPQLLTWARETAGYSLEEIAVASGFGRFPEWEAGERFPTYAQLEKIADKLHRPIAVFFFPEPPDETGIEKSLRAMTEEDVQKLSPLIRQLFRKAKAFQLSLRELWEENPEHRNTVQWMKAVNTQNVKALAREVREILGVSLGSLGEMISHPGGGRSVVVQIAPYEKASPTSIGKLSLRQS